MSPRYKQRSALATVLRAFIPYTRENLMLSFSPNRFFNELERSSKYRQETLKAAYRRANRNGLIKKQRGIPYLTKSGRRALLPFVAKKLEQSGKLMVAFDIPESRANDRRRLRIQLKEWRFKQMQKSVWVSEFDYRADLVEVLSELKIGKYVQIYESALIFPSSDR